MPPPLIEDLDLPSMFAIPGVNALSIFGIPAPSAILES
jgi:hypothetical protein